MILLSTVLTNLIMVIVAMQGVSQKCRNINEYSTAGKVARTKCPVCSEYHRDQNVNGNYSSQYFYNFDYFLECIDNSSPRAAGKPSL